MNSRAEADWAAANQPPPLENADLFALDASLASAITASGGEAHLSYLGEVGTWAGSAEMAGLARAANTIPPTLHTHDARGARIDCVEYPLAYHRLMEKSAEAGLHSARWEAARKPSDGRMVARAAAFYMMAQGETGHLCPVTMTHAAGAALAGSRDIAAEWLPRLAARTHDARNLPVVEKSGVTIGMGMTERQGGTDVRANTTAATPLGGGHYRLDGHKWFFSAPMSDAFLVLAQAPGGLSCFVVPRLRDDGALNGLLLERLKDKLGNRSNASAEVCIKGAEARILGDEGRGLPVILEMAAMTRLDCALASAGLMRAGLVQALHYARRRVVFGAKLAEQPLMRAVLADLAIEVEGAVALSLRVARAYEDDTPESRLFRRVMTPVAKYWICKRAPSVLAEAMEALGGNGYVEDFPLARHYREAPVNSIWEGSGNVMCLDVLRAFNRDSDAFAAVLDSAFGDVAGAGTARDDVLRMLGDTETAEANARVITERIALQATRRLLAVQSPDFVADAFAATRIGVPGCTFGAAEMPSSHVCRKLLERALPG